MMHLGGHSATAESAHRESGQMLVSLRWARGGVSQKHTLHIAQNHVSHGALACVLKVPTPMFYSISFPFL